MTAKGKETIQLLVDVVETMPQGSRRVGSEVEVPEVPEVPEVQVQEVPEEVPLQEVPEVIVPENPESPSEESLADRESQWELVKYARSPRL